MVELLGYLTLAKDIVASLLHRAAASREKPWDELTFALDKLTELVGVHVKAVAEVTAPILTEGDLGETARRYSLLVNNAEFPRGYDSIRGTLAAVGKLRGFQDDTHKELLRAVVDQLSSFQLGVFTLKWDSFKVSDGVTEAAKVAATNSPSEAEIMRVAAPFLLSFVGLFGPITQPPAPEPPKTKAELTALLQDWFKSWQRHVHRASYGGVSTGTQPGGLGSAISQLKMARHA